MYTKNLIYTVLDCDRNTTELAPETEKAFRLATKNRKIREIIDYSHYFPCLVS